MDIRNYFSAVGAKKDKTSSGDSSSSKKSKHSHRSGGKSSKESKKAKRILDSDDDEEPLPPKKKQAAVIDLVDSGDDDLFEVKKQATPTSSPAAVKSTPKPRSGSHKKKPPQEKLKPTTPANFFGNAPVARSADGGGGPVKRKTSNNTAEDDAAFEKTLEQLDEQEHNKRPRLSEEDVTGDNTGHGAKDDKAANISETEKEASKERMDERLTNSIENSEKLDKESRNDETLKSGRSSDKLDNEVDVKKLDKKASKSSRNSDKTHTKSKHEKTSKVDKEGNKQTSKDKETKHNKKRKADETNQSNCEKGQDEKPVSSDVTSQVSPPTQNENSPPNKPPAKRDGLASKLAARFEQYKRTTPVKDHKIEDRSKLDGKDDNDTENISKENAKRTPNRKDEDIKLVQNGEEEKITLSRDDKMNPQMDKKYTIPRLNKEKLDDAKRTPTKEDLKRTPTKQDKPTTKNEPTKVDKPTSNKTPTKKDKPTPKKTPTKQNKVTPTKVKSSKLPKSPDLFLDSSVSTPAAEAAAADTPDEKKQQRAAAYRKFIQRTGPRNPGSKVIPEGEPSCLAGLSFVVSGVLESMDRVEMTELLQQYGAKVVSSVSKKTSFLVVGDEAGASKLAKAEQLGTKVISEDDVLEMLRTRPGKGGHNKAESKVSTPRKPKETTIKTEKKSSAVSPKKEEKKPVSSVSKKEESKPLLSSLERFERKIETGGSQHKASLASPMRPVKTEASSLPSSPCSTSSLSSSQQTQPLSTQELEGRPAEELMWVDKYKPVALKNIIGQQGDKSNARKLLHWLKNWADNQDGKKKKLVKPTPWAKDNDGSFFKAALLSGPPGVGKTTTAQLVCKELGLDTVELNASDTRSKRSLTEEVAQLLSNTSLRDYAVTTGSGATTRHHVLLMDEVDGMAGTEDRGGVQELIALLKSTRVPVICMCNDRHHPKIRSLANYCFDLRFYKPRVEQIRGAMMSVCFREGIKMKADALDQVILSSNQDVRQVLHHLSMFSAVHKNLDSDTVKQDSKRAKKDLKMGPWDVCRQVFSESDRRDMNLHQKSDLFFHDYSIGPLFVQENYWKARPKAVQGKGRAALLRQLAKAAVHLADGDLVERAIRSTNCWALLPTQAMFSCVLPGETMSGHLAGEIEFPAWLGNNSKNKKMDRLAQELHMHMRLRISGTKTDVSLEYSRAVRNNIVRPLLRSGSDGVADAVDAMTQYHLVREDLESLGEFTSWSGKKDDFATGVESKVKAAFTRALNKSSVLNPYSVVVAPKKKRAGGGGGGEEGYGDDEEEDGEMEEEEDGDDVGADAMIKVKKSTVSDGSKGKASAGRSGSGGGGSGKGKGKAKGKK